MAASSSAATDASPYLIELNAFVAGVLFARRKMTVPKAREVAHQWLRWNEGSGLDTAAVDAFFDTTPVPGDANFATHVADATKGFMAELPDGTDAGATLLQVLAAHAALPAYEQSAVHTLRALLFGGSHDAGPTGAATSAAGISAASPSKAGVLKREAAAFAKDAAAVLAASGPAGHRTMDLHMGLANGHTASPRALYKPSLLLDLWHLLWYRRRGAAAYEEQRALDAEQAAADGMPIPIQRCLLPRLFPLLMYRFAADLADKRASQLLGTLDMTKVDAEVAALSSQQKSDAAHVAAYAISSSVHEIAGQLAREASDQRSSGGANGGAGTVADGGGDERGSGRRDSDSDGDSSVEGHAGDEDLGAAAAGLLDLGH